MTFQDHQNTIIKWIKANLYQLFLLGLLVFFTLFYFSRINRVFLESTGDNFTYQLFAETVFSARPFKVNLKFDFYDEHPIFHHQPSFPPLYPIFLAVMHFFFGKSMLVNFYATSILGILCALPVFYLGKQLWSERAGVLAAAITLLLPTMRDTAILGLSEPLYVFLSMWGLYFMLGSNEGRWNRNLVYSGIFIGLAYLTRPNGIALIGAGLLYLLIEKNPLAGEKTLKDRTFRVLLFLCVVSIYYFYFHFI